MNMMQWHRTRLNAVYCYLKSNRILLKILFFKHITTPKN